MKGYRFRLESVLRVRQIQEEQARAALASTRAEITAAQAAAALRDRHYRAAMAGEGEPSATWRAERDRRERLALAVMAARATELHLAEALTARREEWEEAANRLAALEHLDGRDRERFVRERLAEEQRELDELSTSRHGYNDRRRRLEERRDEDMEEDR